MNIFEEFRKIVKAIEANNLKYALVGGVALAFHDQPRFTRDIDLLVIPDDMDNFADVLSKLDFIVSATPWTFKNIDMTLHRFIKIVGDDHLQLDVLTANSERSQQIIQNALDAESEHGTVRVALIEDLIWMKRKRNSDQDQKTLKCLRKGRVKRIDRVFKELSSLYEFNKKIALYKFKGHGNLQKIKSSKTEYESPSTQIAGQKP